MGAAASIGELRPTVVVAYVRESHGGKYAAFGDKLEGAEEACGNLIKAETAEEFNDILKTSVGIENENEFCIDLFTDLQNLKSSAGLGA